MKEYHKINAPFKRNMDGDKKLVVGDWALQEFEFLQDNRWEWTEKVDGTNIRIHFDRYETDFYTFIGGRTDSANIPPHLLDHLNAVFLNEDRQQEVGKMMLEHNITDLTLYGEGYGPKIQGGGKYRDEASFVMFDVQVGNMWLNRDTVDDIGQRLGVRTVPVIMYGTITDAIEQVKSELFSTWGQFEAEGLVGTPAIPMFDRQGRRIITKVKAKDFRT